MPHPESTDRYQWAVLWPLTGYDRYGQSTVGNPIEIRVRWNTTRREAVDSKGNPVVLDVQVVVNQRIAVGSHMVLGTLAQWIGTGSVAPDSELMQVITYTETPDIKGRAAQRTIGLMRLHQPPQ